MTNVTKTQIGFDENGVGFTLFHAANLQAGLYELPAQFTGQAAARYKLTDAGIVDTFTGTDEEFFAAQAAAELVDATAKAQAKRAGKKLTPLEFYGMFTQAELAGIYVAAKTDVNAQIYLDQLQVAQDVTLSDVRTQYGLRMLAAAGLLTTDRAEAIIRGELPA